MFVGVMVLVLVVVTREWWGKGGEGDEGRQGNFLSKPQTKPG